MSSQTRENRSRWSHATPIYNRRRPAKRKAGTNRYDSEKTDILITIVFWVSLLAGDIQLAAHLGGQLNALSTAPLPDGHWRLFRTLNVYTEARTTGEILDRLHQYSRCIDGLILPDAGKTKQQFRSRTELFIGPRHHDMMGEIYDVRSAVEHLHENRYMEGFDRPTRLDLLKKEAIVEYIARRTLARVIGNNALWAHFANTSALAKFWALTATERRQIWGDPIDPMDAIADFDPTHIHNGLLGAP